jgi:mono/diheme cytochrome c family protein
MRTIFYVLLVTVSSAFSGAALAETATLTLSFGDDARSYTAQELLGRADTATITIPNDVSYGREMTYRAVPLLDLLGEDTKAPFDTISARATDGFVSQIPFGLVRAAAMGGGAVAWIAIDDPKDPWPKLPGKDISAGPFYLVWEHPERSGVTTEQWPFALASLTGVESPARRWPQMAVAADAFADAPARRGQTVFIKQCLPCHRMKGGGEGTMGPDLGQPMNPTQYMTETGLRALIRDPKAVRTWPEQQMQGFDETMLPEADLDDLIAYLTYMAGTPR